MVVLKNRVKSLAEGVMKEDEFAKPDGGAMDY